jgi:oxygen-independent coproporphyrinogen-3 oxidase
MVDKGQLALPNDDILANMYEQTVSLMIDHGFDHYEVSSYARSRSSRSVHNQGYWIGRNYIGKYLV